jgi:hypothetical protein
MNRDEVFKGMEELDSAHPTPASRSGQFFHGTTSAVKDGMVRPANAVDKHVSEYSMGDPGDMSEGDHAFVIRNNENYAWHAAMKFHPNGQRPRVYETEPADDMKPGPWNREHPDFLAHHELDIPEGMDYDHEAQAKEVAKVRANHQDEWASPTGFKVKQRIDIAPGHQGTFPEFNWNRFKDGGPRSGPDVNHPSDSQVQYGTHALADRSGDTTVHAEARNLNQSQFHDWRADPAPHSPLREAAGRPQKRWATLLD